VEESSNAVAALVIVYIVRSTPQWQKQTVAEGIERSKGDQAAIFARRAQEEDDGE
jgi:hypothetical protein